MNDQPAIFRPRSPERETCARINPDVLRRDLNAEPIELRDQMRNPMAMRLLPGDSVIIATQLGTTHFHLCWAAGRQNLLLIDKHDLAEMPH